GLVAVNLEADAADEAVLVDEAEEVSVGVVGEVLPVEVELAQERADLVEVATAGGYHRVAQGGEQAVMDAVERPRAEHHDHVSRTDVLDRVLDDLIDVLDGSRPGTPLVNLEGGA